ncbi:MAG: hypothetical protein IJU12_13015 [Clostridia bacterium]|nr:hypothetical protein [Clostridia bacterium]
MRQTEAKGRLVAVCLLIGGLVLHTQRVHARQQGEMLRNMVAMLLRREE